jgi:hypothetical protein
MMNAKSGNKRGLFFVNGKIVLGSKLLVWSLVMKKVGF